MLESLTEKITGVLERLGGKARLTEETINEALREVRLALLEADVNFKVAKTFVARVKERCLTAEVLDARGQWSDPARYDAQATELAALMHNAFKPFAPGVSQAVRDAAPLAARSDA